ncbi:MAG: hypothetical protein QNK37_21755 [Acidobacteriota bacterium]|nr:hypothetical protein [Acidobacteriota bacterium]
MKGDHTYFNINATGREYLLENAYAVVRNLEFKSAEKFVDQRFIDYKDLRERLFRHEMGADEVARPRFPEDENYRDTFTHWHYKNGKMMVLVDSNVYPAIRKSLDQYVLDVGREGYWATVHIITGGTPRQVRQYIENHKPVGVLMVGAIAAAWYDLDGSEFPCDLYYMDTNGTWTDPDGDGRFETHSGDLDPEIWVGRLYTPTNNGNDTALLNDYFNRNHRFRLGELGHAHSALAYVDDDWTGFGDCAFSTMLPPSVITQYTNPMTTDADLYKAEVNSRRSWVQVCAHSSPGGHAFRVGGTSEYLNSQYFRDENPPNAFFYNLFACGPGKFTHNDYLGGWYIFDKGGGGTNHGLTAVASAKSGSMLYFEDFYAPMRRGMCIGDAYLNWWRARGPVHDPGEILWFYGLTLLGDPTLNWWKGNVPALRQPQPNDTFDHWPRRMEMRWDPVNVPGVTYSAEIDAFGALQAGKWAEAINKSFYTVHSLTGTSLQHNFVGAQRGRWRVRARIDGQMCRWSPWSYFRFTV